MPNQKHSDITVRTPSVTSKNNISLESHANDNSYSTLLLSRFHKVIQQGRRGARSQERLARLLEDVAQLQQTFANGLSRVVETGITDLENIGCGNVTNVTRTNVPSSANTRALLMTLSHLIDYCDTTHAFGTTLSAFVEPMMQTVRSDTKRIRQIEIDEISLSKQIDALTNSLEKSRKQCEKSLTPMVETGFTNSSDKKKKRLSAKANEKILQYFATIDSSNSSLIKLTQERRILLGELQQIERERMLSCEHIMVSTAHSLNESSAKFRNSASHIASAMANVDIDEELSAFATLRASRRTSSPHWPIRFKATQSVAKTIGNVVNDLHEMETFHAPLELTMAIQRSHNDELPIPRVLLHLMETMRANSGALTEGVFRKSVSQTEMKALQARVEQGDNLLVGSSVSPLAAAALIKKILRDLPQSVIPSNQYGAALELGQLDSHSNVNERVAINRFVSSLPETRAYIIQSIVNFVRELLQPHYAAHNKMSIEAFAIVLTPALLRVHSDIPADILGNVEAEVAFVSKLLRFVDTSAYEAMIKADSSESVDGNNLMRAKSVSKPRKSVSFAEQLSAIEQDNLAVETLVTPRDSRAVTLRNKLSHDSRAIQTGVLRNGAKVEPSPMSAPESSDLKLSVLAQPTTRNRTTAESLMHAVASEAVAIVTLRKQPE